VADDKELSLRDQIVAARDEYNAKEGGVNEPAALEEPKEVAEPAAATAEPEEKAAPAAGRDASGRFVSTKAEKAEAAPPVAEPPAIPDITAPNSWTAAEKAFWEKIPREVKQIIERREGDAHRAITKQDEERAFAKEFAKATAPYEAQLRAMNTTPMQAYQTLLNATYILRTGTPQQKLELIANAARDAGIDLRQAFSQQGYQQQPQQQMAQLPPQIMEELQASRKWREQIAAERQSAETESYNQTVSQIEEFRANPANPHFDAVRETMVSLIQSGAAKDLQSAYDMATWATPSIRAQLQVTKPDAVQVQRQKVTQAKQKGVSVRGGPGNAPDATKAGGKSLRQELEAAFREQSGRV
jgi:hypothetical protein